MRRPLVWLLAALMSGAALASLFHPSFKPFLVMFLLAWSSAILFIIAKRRAPASFFVLSASFLLGTCSYLLKDSVAEIPDQLASHYASERPAPVKLTGIVSRVRSMGDTGLVTFILDIEGIEVAGQNARLSGRTQVTWRRPSVPIEPGDEVSVKGQFSLVRGFRNPGVFDYERFMHRRGIFTKLFAQGPGAVAVQSKANLNWPLRLRERIRRDSLDIIRRSTRTAETRAFVSAILLDERGLLTKQMDDWFRRTGTFHVISISGLHVGLVYLIVSLALSPLPLGRRTRVLAAILVVWLYAFITGANVPVMRSAIMLTLVLAEYYLARESDFLSAIGLAAFVIVAFDPLVIDDISFQLSFLAVVLLCTFEPLFKNTIRPLALQKLQGVSGTVLHKLTLTLFASLIVGIGMHPVVAYHFNQASLVFPIANLIVIPMTSLVLACGFACLLAGFIWIKAAVAFGFLVEAFSWIVFGTVKLLSMIPASSIRVASPPLWVLGLEAFAILLVWWRGRWIRRAAVFAIAVLLTSSSAFAAKWFANDRLKLTFLDLGDADSCLVEFPNGRSILIDTGFSIGYMDCGERVVAPFLWRKGITQIDALVLTHPDADHIGGAPFIMKNFRVGHLLLPEMGESPSAFRQVLLDAAERGLPVTRVGAGDSLALDENVQINVLNPPPATSLPNPSDNEISIALRLMYGKTSLLLPGDIEKKGLRLLCDSGQEIRSQALKASHHGLASGFDTRFIEMVNPELIVISGRERPTKAIANKRLSRYASLERTVLTTHNCGAVAIVSDGLRLATKLTRRPRTDLF